MEASTTSADGPDSDDRLEKQGSERPTPSPSSIASTSSLASTSSAETMGLPSDRSQTSRSLPDPSPSAIDALATSLVARAQRLARRNDYILTATIAVIMACIYIFWKSDTIVEHLGRLDTIQKTNEVQRKKLADERDAMRKQYGETEASFAAAEMKEKAAKLIEIALNTIFVFTQQYKSGGKLDESQRDLCKARIDFLLKSAGTFNQASGILQGIAEGAQGGINIELQNERILIPASILKEMGDEVFRIGGVKANALANVIANSDKALRSLRIALGGGRDDDIQRELAGLESLINAPYRGVEKAYEWYVEERKKQGSAWAETRLRNIRQEMDRLDNQISALDKQNAELQQKAYESVNSYGAWVPSLAIRVCCVILALFMTQFFMSIYRYNTMIGSHYHSRADVLRMACSEGQRDPVNADTFAKLVASMAMEKIDFVLPDSVIDKVVTAASTRLKERAG